ncbi:MAG TPA: hypothetical protein VFD52_07790 [Clostridia bacterium]|nr:hypothetical protein [Clostridia bacterium]
MDRFDDIISTAKTFGECIGDKAKNFAVVSNKRLKLVESETKIEKLFSHLGKIYYDSFSDDCDDENMKDIISEIDLVKNSIANIKADIELLKNK